MAETAARPTPTVTVVDELPDLWLVTPPVHHDDRGLFSVPWHAAAFAEAGLPPFVQANQSRSRRHVLRGLHFQAPPHEQGKLVRVVHGRVFDVAVDLRRRSATFGRWFGTYLDGDEPRWLWVPAGFAHGFLAVSDVADVVYMVTHDYAPAAEGGVAWDDPDLAIAWPLAAGTSPVLSAKDGALPHLRDQRSPF